MFEAWHLKQQEVTQNEEALRQQLMSLPEAQRTAFYKHYTPRIKDPDTYAALNWFFIAGLHNFYLGQWLLGLLDLGIVLVGTLLLFVEPAIGLSLLLLISLMEVPALFRSQVIVAHRNNQTGFRILKRHFQVPR